MNISLVSNKKTNVVTNKKVENTVTSKSDNGDDWESF
jgi:hypothetical protein